MKKIGAVVKKHLLTGISYMIPLIVAAGLSIALAQIFGGIDVDENKGTIPYYLYQIGNWGMSLVVPLISAAIALSIADRPGLAPGLVVGLIANEIDSGFIGGLIGGFLVGYIVLAIKKYIKVPKSMSGLMPIMIIPVLTTIISGLLMLTVIGIPISALQDTLINFLKSMNGGSNFAMGSILGAMASFDFGGPVNKTMSLFADGLLVDGIYGPEAVKIIGSMVPPFGIGLSFLLARNKYTKTEKEALKAAVPMGVFMITEGVIPIAVRDLVRVVVSCSFGSAIAGGMSLTLGVGSTIPHGGLLITPLVTHPLYFLLCLGVGTVITGVTLSIWKPIAAEDEKVNDEDDDTADDELDSIDFKTG
jgi:PTS system fructose-specific IIC component